MAGKKGENARSNRIRFIMLDADLGDGNLTELTGAITQALRPIHPAPKPVQQIAARRVEDDAFGPRRKGRDVTSESVTVVNQLGMHARAAAKFVHLATRFEARVRVSRDRREMDGKSIMGILLLAAARGSTITISADGGDETEAIAALVMLVERGFDEDACTA